MGDKPGDEREDFFPVRIHYSEMNETDQELVVEMARSILRKSERPTHHKDTAQAIKNQLDAAKGGVWHVVIGTSFGSYVSNESKTLLHFSIGNIAYMVWRHG